MFSARSILLLPVVTAALSAPAMAAAQDQADAAEQDGPTLDVVERAMTPRTGDYDALVKRRLIRVLTVFGRTSYFVDRGRQRGITYEAFKEFEDFVNRREKTGTLKIHVLLIPVRRDQLIPYLAEGRADVAAANLTITQGRLEQVEFADPVLEGVRELVVTGPESPALRSLNDLAGQEVTVRRSSSYYASLERLNAGLKAAGKPGILVTPANENLEDEDLLEMVNAGLLPITVVDSHLASFWSQVFDRISVHDDLAVRTGGQIAWAVRKGSPGLKGVLNEFVKQSRKGTRLGNVLFQRYLKDTQYVRSALASQDRRRFDQAADLFQKYAVQYGFDWLLVAAQAYQESRLDQGLRSPAGAIGVMQVLPGTAAGPPISIGNVERLDNNIHAGVKYLRHVRDQQFADPKIDSFNAQLFTFAAYNAGPARVAGLRKKAAAMGLDANKWFQNVEIVAAREIGRETVQYVSNILKYYVAYQRIAAQAERRDKAKESLKGAN
jgi:membrane-bound lytic murein transglycosylase MltF